MKREQAIQEAVLCLNEQYGGHPIINFLLGYEHIDLLTDIVWEMKNE